MSFCEKCKSIMITVGQFSCCSNKKCNPKVKKSGYFSNKSTFVRNKTTGSMIDTVTGTEILNHKEVTKQ